MALASTEQVICKTIKENVLEMTIWSNGDMRSTPHPTAMSIRCNSSHLRGPHMEAGSQGQPVNDTIGKDIVVNDIIVNNIG